MIEFCIEVAITDGKVPSGVLGSDNLLVPIPILRMEEGDEDDDDDKKRRRLVAWFFNLLDLSARDIVVFDGMSGF